MYVRWHNRMFRMQSVAIYSVYVYEEFQNETGIIVQKGFKASRKKV